MNLDTEIGHLLKSAITLEPPLNPAEEPDYLTDKIRIYTHILEKVLIRIKSLAENRYNWTGNILDAPNKVNEDIMKFVNKILNDIPNNIPNSYDTEPNDAIAGGKTQRKSKHRTTKRKHTHRKSKSKVHKNLRKSHKNRK